MSDTRTTAEEEAALLRFDLADRLTKSLRVAKVKPGQMRAVLGVSESTMTNYLNGVTTPKDGFLRQWALRCGHPVSFDWLKYGLVPAAGGPDGPPDQQIHPSAWTVVTPLHRARENRAA